MRKLSLFIASSVVLAALITTLATLAALASQSPSASQEKTLPFVDRGPILPGDPGAGPPFEPGPTPFAGPQLNPYKQGMSPYPEEGPHSLLSPGSRLSPKESPPLSFSPLPGRSKGKGLNPSTKRNTPYTGKKPDRRTLRRLRQGPKGLKGLLREAERKGEVRVIVALKAPYKPEGRLDGRRAVRNQRSKISSLQDAVLSKVRPSKASSVKRYRFIAAMAMKVNVGELTKLASLHQVERVREDTLARPSLSESAPLIGAPQVWDEGATGDGKKIAILDSGVDKTHPFLAGKVVSEACYSENLCPAGEGAYEGAGVNCSAIIPGCEHGTHAAGIAAGDGPDFSGIAKDARLISIQVASSVGDPSNPTLRAYESDILSGLERVYEMRSGQGIVAVNVGFSSGVHLDNCDSDYRELKAAIDTLRSERIATVAAAGNDSNWYGVGLPACISTAVSVGSTTKQDQVSDFSNRAPFMSLYAPGEAITSSVPGGGFAAISGTSMASAHVAGAWAVLKSAYPNLGVGSILRSLTSTGLPIDDGNYGYTNPRIQLAEAYRSLRNPQGSGHVDLLDQANVRIDGAPSRDLNTGKNLGKSVAGAGDVNGDDIPDVILGVPYANYGGYASGSAYVIFGQRSTTTIELDSLGDRGFRLDGAAGGFFNGVLYNQGESAGASVAGAGDINDDGKSDVIVGAPWAKHNDRPWSGSAYVVFGKSSTEAVNLKDFGTLDGPDRERGYRIDGAHGGFDAGDLAGSSVSGAGDVNGDGTPDVIIGAPEADNNSLYNSGSAYVVFGKATYETVDLAQLGSSGFRIDGATVYDETGTSAAGAGDVNGDGTPDVIVGAPGASNNGREDSGSAYVVFGKSSTTTIDLANLGSGGFRIDGATPNDGTGRSETGASVSGAGDMNDDGRAEVIVGAFLADNNGRQNSGSAYVVFGKSSTESVDLANFGDENCRGGRSCTDAGFRIDGVAAGDGTGGSVAGAGDINGDGTPDVIVGAAGANNNGRLSGSAYVVFGKSSTDTVDLADFGRPGSLEGFRMDSPGGWGEGAGASVDGAGDVNGDGLDDVIVGAPNSVSSSAAGSAYAVFGSTSTATVELGDLGTPDGPDRDRGYRIDGTTTSPSGWGESAGTSVAGAGDVNGDGREDVIVGAPLANTKGRVVVGSAYVIFGQESLSTADLAVLGRSDCRTCTPGFRIDGVGGYNNSGSGNPVADAAGGSVAGAGDINGDGKADVIVGARGAVDGEGYQTGSAYVVFGSSSTETVDLADLCVRGFRIVGGGSHDLTGISVEGAGDINGDGKPDVIVGAPGANNNGRFSGSAYVVYGKSSTGTVDLKDFGTPDGPDRDKGFRIDGAAGAPETWLYGDYMGDSVAITDDMNDDGRAEVIVGAFLADNNGRVESGSAYVVYGKSSTDTVDLSQLGSGGFRIDGAAAGDYSVGDTGRSVAGAGDVNGDGTPDVIVGAPFSDNNGRNNSGSAYVVFGKSSTATVDLANLGAGGFRIDGPTGGGLTGYSVSGAGDINGDGTPDVTLLQLYRFTPGEPPESPESLFNHASAYVVYGKSSTETVDLDDLGSGGFEMEGVETLNTFSSYVVDRFGGVAGAGDFNGDGHPDVIVGAPGADNNNRRDSGSAYIVYGFGPEQETLTDPDCRGTNPDGTQRPYNNDFLIREFAVETDPSTSTTASRLTLRGLVCGTELRSEGHPNGDGKNTITDHVDFKVSSSVYHNASVGGGLPEDAYVGSLEGRLAYHDTSGNPVIEPASADITVDDLQLRQLENPNIDPADNCNREAEEELAGNNVGINGDGIWNFPSEYSTIFTCFKVTGTTDSGVDWHAWLWKTVTLGCQPEGGEGSNYCLGDLGHYLTLGPVHLDNAPDTEAGFTHIGNRSQPPGGGLKLCDYANTSAGATDCGTTPTESLKVHENGAVAANCDGGVGLYKAVATRKDEQRTTAEFSSPNVANTCVTWVPPARKRCSPVSISFCLERREIGKSGLIGRLP